MKKEITSFDVASVVSELKPLITDAWVTNIYQTDYKTLLFKLHKADQPVMNLLIEAGKRLHLTDFAIEKPPKPSGFCMTLRTHLRNGRIQAVEQHEFERIVVLRIQARHEGCLLVTELFGEGNIILVDAHNKILQALSYRKMRDRNILRNETFKYPPSSGKDPFKLKRTDLDEIQNLGSLQIVKALARFLGTGGFYAEEILLRAHIEKDAPSDSLSSTQLDSIFSTVRELLSSVEKGELEPAIIVDEKDEWIDVVPFKLRKYADFRSLSYPSFNEALDRYYAKKAVKGEIVATTTDAEQLLAQQERIKAKQEKTLRESEKEIEENKRIGNVIYAHFGELQQLIHEILNAKSSGKTWDEITSTLEQAKGQGKAPYYGALDSRNMLLHLNIDQATFTINLRKSIQDNAAEYYEKAKKAEKRREGAEKALQDTKQKMAELERQKTAKIAEIEEPLLRKMEKKAWYEKFRWFHSSEGFLVLGGKDAATNEILIKKYTEPNDMVFHANITGAPFVVVKTEGRTPSEQTVKEAAEFAAAYSHAWREMFASVDVYWVHPEQMNKTPPPGQFLPKGAFMIYGKKNYLRKVPLKIAVGITTKGDGQVKIIGGPPDAIVAQTSVFVQIVPGEQTSEALAKNLRELLAQKSQVEVRERVLRVRLEEFQAFIPSGKGTILR